MIHVGKCFIKRGSVYCVFYKCLLVCVVGTINHCGDPQRAGPHKADVLFYVCGFISTLKITSAENSQRKKLFISKHSPFIGTNIVQTHITLFYILVALKDL